MSKKSDAKSELEIRLSVLHKDADGTHTNHTAYDVTDPELCAEILELLAPAVAEQTDVEAHPESLDAHKFVLDGVTWAEKKKKLDAEAKKKSAA